MSLIEEIKLLRELAEQATPGPWYYDCGNGEVESRKSDLYRQPVVIRCDLMDRVKHFKDHDIEYSPPNSPVHPDADCMYIEMADPVLITRLCDALDPTSSISLRNVCDALEKAIGVLKEVQTSPHWDCCGMFKTTKRCDCHCADARALLKEWGIE